MPIDELTNEARVLIAVVPRVRDLAIAREQHWYRVPLDRAPRHVGVEAIAFYQTAVFGEERWQVRTIACVQRVEIKRRVELLPDEPDHVRANLRYLCFHLDALELLPLPVPSARLRRISFIPTTLGQILRARDVRELWHPEEDNWLRGDVWAAGLAGKTIK